MMDPPHRYAWINLWIISPTYYEIIIWTRKMVKIPGSKFTISIGFGWWFTLLKIGKIGHHIGSMEEIGKTSNIDNIVVMCIQVSDTSKSGTTFTIHIGVGDI